MDASANPHTPPNARAPAETPQSSPLFGTPSSVGVSGGGQQNSPAQRHQPPNRQIGVNQFMNNEQFSDITIIYGYGGSSRFKAHKVLLASASLWFQAAFTNPAFIESDASEITLHDDDELAMTTMLKSCYNPPINSYHVGPPWSATESAAKRNSNAALLYHVDVYIVADKYLMPQLRLRAAFYVGKWMNRYLDVVQQSQASPGPIIAIINLHGCLSKIYEAAAAGNENTPLRKAVLDVIMSHVTTRSTGPPGIMTAEVMRCVREIDGFGRDMYVRTMGEAAKLGNVAYLEVVEEVQCPHCQNRWMKPMAEAWSVVRCISCGLPAQWSAHTVARTM